jgi:hypothetical protein
MYKCRATLLLIYMGFFGPSTLLTEEPGLAEHAQVDTPAKQASQNTGAPAKVKFENTGMGEMKDGEGVPLGFTNFKGSDGSTLTVLYKRFENSATAQAYFERQILKAMKVVERNKKLNTSGNAAGDRAEILLRFEAQKSIPAILWTDGAMFHEIYSSSRKSMLDLEEVYKY